MTVARVLLADDHALVRAGIRALLENLPDIEVVAEAGDGREALRLMAIYHPDLVLMDVAMPGMNGLEALAEIVKNYPAALVLILSMYSFEEYVLRALHLGARGYLLKDAAPAELEIAVRAVQRGETYLSPPISRCVVMEYLLRVGGASENVSNGLLADLTPHECAVLHLIAEGDSNETIAAKLDVGVEMVELSISQIMKHLNINDVVDLMRYATHMVLEPQR